MIETGPNISDAEWRVMHEIWQLEPCTSHEVISRLSVTSDWTAGTIKTLLHRLVQKGVLDFRRKGSRYLYRANYTESECIDHASDQLLHTVFQSQPIPMLEYLVRSSRLSGSEVDVLRSLLETVQANLPSVPERVASAAKIVT